MKKITVSILTTLLMLSMVFSSSVFAANEEKASAWDSFLGLFSAKTAATSDFGVEYRGHIQNVGNYPLDGSWIQGPTELGTEGQGLRLEGFWIQLDGDVPAGAHIEYQVHVQNVGWMDPVQDGAFAGTEGRSLQIEAIKISLVDDEGAQLEDYSVVYTGHVQNIGDVGPYTNGEQLGTVGSFLRLEAITVEIVKNPVDLTEYEAALAAVTQADYTAASWTTYQAVVNANVVDEDNTQSEVDAATANITAAQANLVKVLKVESVSAINGKQLQVTFSAPVAASSIISDTTVGTLNSGIFTVARTTAATDDTNKNVNAFSTGFLSTDGKVLTLTASGNLYFDGTYSLTVSDKVKTPTDMKLVPFAGTFALTDTVAPVVTGLTYNTVTGNIEATLSEPITLVPSIVRINGTPVTTGISFVANSNNTKVAIVKPSTVAAGTTAEVYLAGATDFAANQLTGYTGNVAITTDATALAVTSMTQSGSNVIKVVFNKSIASTDTVVNGATTVLMDGTAFTSGVSVAKDANDTQNKTYLITVAGAEAAPKYFYGTSTTKNLVVTFTNNIITDVFGQTLATSTTTVAMTKDTLGPVAKSVKVSDDGAKFEITFDESIATGGGIVPGSVVLRKDGVALATTTSAVRKGTSDADSKVLIVTPASGIVNGVIPAGTYTVRLEAGAVEDLNTNNNLAQTLTIPVSGTATKLTADITNAADNKFLIEYSADVTSATALNLANYTLDGAALPTGTDIYFTAGHANRIVQIDLPSESVNVSASGAHTYASLAVSNVKSADNITVTPVATNVYVLDNTKPVLQSAKVIDNKTIELTYNEAMYTLSGDAVDDEFVIKQAGSIFAIGSGHLEATNVSGYPTKVRVTINQGTDTPASVGSITKSNATGATLAAPSGTFTGTSNVTYKVKVVTVADGTTNDVPATWAISTDNGATYGTAGTSTTLGNGLTLGSFTEGTTDSAVDDTFTFTATAATSALVLDLNKTTTIGTIETAGTANMKDLAENIQKVDVTVTAN